MNLYLGIDIGTTSIATVIIDKSDLLVKSVFASPHNAYIPKKNGFAEQDVDIILSMADQLIRSHPMSLIQKVKAIGVAGQMHGILLWNKTTKKHSNLITWQNKRASIENILDDFKKKKNCSKLYDGLGLTTLATIYYNQKKNLNEDVFNLEKNEYNCCGTIMDYIVWLYTGSQEKPSIDASWGLFDIETNCWDLKTIEDLGIVKNILPTIVKTGSQVGLLCSEISI